MGWEGSKKDADEIPDKEMHNSPGAAVQRRDPPDDARVHLYPVETGVLEKV